MEVLLLLVMGATNLLCFVVGAKVGQSVSKDEPIEMPKLNPMEIYREQESKREAKKEQDKMDTIMRNIESYDGTGRGQEEVE